MSYSILYRSMFVKMSDGRFIPMIESGSNNCYDVMWNGRQRRERSWHRCTFGNHKGQLALTREEIMQDVESIIDHEKKRVGQPYADYEHKEGVYTEQEIEQRFGYYSAISIAGKHTSTTSAQQVRNFFLRGFDQAVTFDECRTMRLTWANGKEPDSEYRTHYERRTVESEAELVQTWEELTAAGFSPSISYDYNDDSLWNSHRKRVERKPPQPKTSGFVVQFGHDYIYKMSARHMWRAGGLGWAKKYATRASAEKAAEKLNTCYDSVKETAYVVAVSKNAETGEWEQAA